MRPGCVVVDQVFSQVPCLITISVDAAGRHSLHVDEVGSENAAGLGCQELPPGRAGAAGREIDCSATGVMLDLPHVGARNPVAEPDQFALQRRNPQPVDWFIADLADQRRKTAFSWRRTKSSAPLGARLRGSTVRQPSMQRTST